MVRANRLSIEIDPAAMQQFSTQEITEKRNVLGICRRNDNTYVLTTHTHRGNLPFISKLDKIAEILRKARFSDDQLPQITTTHNVKGLQYLDCLFKAIHSHNRKLRAIQNNDWIRFLGSIPLIHLFVQWLFKETVIPRNFETEWVENSRNAINQTLSRQETLNDLKRLRNNLIAEINSACEEQNPNAVAGVGLLYNNWQVENDQVNSEFETQVGRMCPALRLARRLSSSEDNEIFELPVNATLVQANQKFIEAQKAIDTLGEFEIYLSEGQKRDLAQGKARLSSAYANWHLKRLRDLYTPPKRPVLAAIFGTDRIDQWASKYNELFQLLSRYDDRFFSQLTQEYKGYLSDQWSELGKKLKNGAIFNRNTPQDLHKSYEWRKQCLEEIKSFAQLTKFLDSKEIDNLSAQVKNAYYDALGKLVPIFKRSIEVENDSGRKSGDWYLDAHIYFTAGMEKLGHKDCPNEILKIIQGAAKKVREGYGTALEDFLKELPKPAVGRFGIFDSGKEHFMKEYQQKLFKILAIDQDEQIDEAFKKFQAQTRLCSNAKVLSSLTSDLIASYRRSKEILPYLDAKLTLDGLKIAPDHIEAELIKVIEKLKIESSYQTNSKYMRDKIATAQTALENCLENWLTAQFPQYRLLLEYQRILNVAGTDLGYYVLRLDWNNSQQAKAILDVKLADLAKLEKATHPKKVSEAISRAKAIAEWAYRQHEANRICNGLHINKQSILGLPFDTSEIKMRRRWAELSAILHSDKNAEAPAWLRNLFDTAFKKLNDKINPTKEIELKY